MIQFQNDNKEMPYIRFKELYNLALERNQTQIEAILIASYDSELKEVDARYVNLKFIDNNKFIFFSNLESPKSKQFNSHDQISAVFHWKSINAQIRMKAKISKLSSDLSNAYFKNRDISKNALAISSMQSKKIASYKKVEENFNSILKNENLTICPNYWGGFVFTPYYFEFWEGQEYRLNKREAYEMSKNQWDKYFMQP